MLHATHATSKGNMEHHNAIMPCTVMLPVILLTMIATKFWRNVATNVRTLEYGATIQYTEPQLWTRDMPLLLLWECGCQGREGWWSTSADRSSNASAATWRGIFWTAAKCSSLFMYHSRGGTQTHITLGALYGCNRLWSHLPILEHRISRMWNIKIWWTAEWIIVVNCVWGLEIRGERRDVPVS